jgi:outer membrane protein assembly factor BamE (lipoprotein component of BamABCDE complex)
MEGYPVSKTALDRVEMRMDMQEVESLIGAPDTKDGVGRLWVYSGFTWTMVTVKFDQQRRVSDVVIDR